MQDRRILDTARVTHDDDHADFSLDLREETVATCSDADVSITRCLERRASFCLRSRWNLALSPFFPDIVWLSLPCKTPSWTATYATGNWAHLRHTGANTGFICWHQRGSRASWLFLNSKAQYVERVSSRLRV